VRAQAFPHSAPDFWDPIPVQTATHCIIRGWRCPVFDHCSAYTFDGIAAAIASHVYCRDVHEAVCRNWNYAVQHELDIKVMSDFPSWWNPKKRTLVVWAGAVVRQGWE
jgi:hypothetical protein